MNIATTRDRLLDEISKIPDEKVADIYNFIHDFRLGLQVREVNPNKILKLAGSWKDMPEEDFNEFLEDVVTRRKNAFSLRKNRETSTN